MREISEEDFRLFEVLKKIWLHSVPEKSGKFFICGEGGEHDEFGLPEIILVCPAMGSNITAIYEKKKVGRAGQ